MADPLSIAGGVLGIVSLAAQVVATSQALLTAIREEHRESVIVLSFRSLQAERIENLQQKIINLTGDLRENQQDLGELDGTLHTYGKDSNHIF